MSVLQNPMHPGEVLNELYLAPLNMSALALAKRLLVPRTRIERLVKGTTSMTPDTALRLSKAFGTTPDYWMTMQLNFDMAKAKAKVDLSKIEPLAAA